MIWLPALTTPLNQIRLCAVRCKSWDRLIISWRGDDEKSQDIVTAHSHGSTVWIERPSEAKQPSLKKSAQAILLETQEL